MKITILTLLLLSSMAGFGQNKLIGTIWKDAPRYIESEKDSMCFALDFKDTYVAFYGKWKKLAKVHDYEEMKYELIGNKVTIKPQNRKTEWYEGLIGDGEIRLTQHIKNTDGVWVEQSSKFFLSVENTLNGTVWENVLSEIIDGSGDNKIKEWIEFEETTFTHKGFINGKSKIMYTGNYYLKGDTVVTEREWIWGNYFIIQSDRVNMELPRRSLQPALFTKKGIADTYKSIMAYLDKKYPPVKRKLK